MSKNGDKKQSFLVTIKIKSTFISRRASLSQSIKANQEVPFYQGRSTILYNIEKHHRLQNKPKKKTH